MQSMVTNAAKTSQNEDTFLGYRIRERDGIYIAVPLEWARGSGETIVAGDLPTLRKEIRRWWFQVGV